MGQRFLFHSSEPKVFLYFFHVFWIRFFQLLLFTLLYLFILIISLLVMFSSFCLRFFCLFSSFKCFSGNTLPQFFSSHQNVICADIKNLYDIRNVLCFLVKHLAYWTQPKWQFWGMVFPKGAVECAQTYPLFF